MSAKQRYPLAQVEEGVAVDVEEGLGEELLEAGAVVVVIESVQNYFIACN